MILLKYGLHPNICRLFEVYHTPDTVAMVMELIDGGDLFDGWSSFHLPPPLSSGWAFHV